MPNETQNYIKTTLEFAQADLRPYGINLGLKGPEFNSIRVVDLGVKSIKTSAINSRRQYQKATGVPVGQQEYLYPLKDAEGNPVVDAQGKKVSVLLQYAVIKQVDPQHAEGLRLKIANQAEGAFKTARQMEEV